MKKICILQNGFIRGGTERFVINLCKGLKNLEPGTLNLEPERSTIEPASGYEITVINPSTDPQLQVLEADVRATGANILHTTTLNGLRGRLHHLLLLYKELRQGHFDVFQTNLDLFNGPNLFVAWLARVPIRVCHSHASMQETEIRTLNPLNSSKGALRSAQRDALTKSLLDSKNHLNHTAIRLYQAAMRWLCWHFSNRRVGCSDLANDFLYKGHDWRNQPFPTVIFNGIELERFKVQGSKLKDQSSKHKVQSSKFKVQSRLDHGTLSLEPKDFLDLGPLSLEPNKKYLLVIGRCEPQKNPFFILEVFKALRKRRDDVQLLWVGDGSLMPQVKKEVQALGLCASKLKDQSDLEHETLTAKLGELANNLEPKDFLDPGPLNLEPAKPLNLEPPVRFLGWRDDIPALMQHSNLLLMPSLYEGLSITLIEAQASGLPCLVSDVITPQAQCGLIQYKSLNDSIDSWVSVISDIVDGNHHLAIDRTKLERFSITTLASQMQLVFNYC